MIVLIRHGRTKANEQHLYCGSSDLPLSSGGREALQELHFSFSNVQYLTSGMRRTEETLEILFGTVPHEAVPAFREIDFGSFEMHSYEELKDDPAYQAWISGDNERNVPPNGESGEAMKVRVLHAFSELLAYGKDTVLITHGGVIAAIMEAYFPGEQKNRYLWQPKPGHGYRLEAGGYFEV